jgi:hypothetical protein
MTAWTARDLGCLYRDTGRAGQAEPLLRRSEQMFRQLGDARQLARSLKDLGVLYLGLAAAADGDRPVLAGRAAAFLEEGLSLAEQLGAGQLAAWLLRYLGVAEALQGRVEAGRDRIARARGRFSEFTPANQALCDFLAAHLDQVKRPHLLELFGHLPLVAAREYGRLLQAE